MYSHVLRHGVWESQNKEVEKNRQVFCGNAGTLSVPDKLAAGCGVVSLAEAKRMDEWD